ncbi:MAG: hypothetical protein JWQ09_3582 [Segetibacter sp.]|nr:hypothetical protein [Segetibacter sp.]
MKKSFLFSTWALFSLLLVLFIVTCKKEYSYEGGRLAAYTLVGSPGKCANANINGSYFAGISLNSSNSVQVEVKVTAVGTYIISTNAVNGISFSASGNFSDTGFYQVVLEAHGIPGSSGMYQLQIPGTNGCFFPLEVKEKPLADYILSGAFNECENPEINGLYAQNKTLDNSNTVTLKVEIFTIGNYTITTDTTDGIFFSASGNFNITGKQKITLTGSGTPKLPGLIYFKVSGLTSECSFKIPIRNDGALATYVLESKSGNPNPCTPQSINGTYATAVSLSSADTVNITAYVTIPGNFNISTDSLNGMIFKYSGNFTSTGRHTVTLTGTGSPKASGVFTFIPQIIGPAPIGGNECGFDIAVQ